MIMAVFVNSESSGNYDQSHCYHYFGPEKMMMVRGWHMASCCHYSQLPKPKHPPLPAEDGVTRGILRPDKSSEALLVGRS